MPLLIVPVDLRALNMVFFFPGRFACHTNAKCLQMIHILNSHTIRDRSEREREKQVTINMYLFVLLFGISIDRKSFHARRTIQTYWPMWHFLLLTGAMFQSRDKMCTVCVWQMFWFELNATKFSCIINNSRGYFLRENNTKKYNGKWNEFKRNGIKIDQCLEAIQMLIDVRRMSSNAISAHINFWKTMNVFETILCNTITSKIICFYANKCIWKQGEAPSPLFNPPPHMCFVRFFIVWKYWNVFFTWRLPSNAEQNLVKICWNDLKFKVLFFSSISLRIFNDVLASV